MKLPELSHFRPSALLHSSSTTDHSAPPAAADRNPRRLTIHSTSDIKDSRPLPTGLVGAFRAWLEMSEQEAEQAELRILRRMPYFRLPHEPDPEPSSDPSRPAVVARQYRLEVLPGQQINALEIRLARPPPLPPAATSASLSSAPHEPTAPVDDQVEEGDATLFTHGYGCGLGHYWRQFETMADVVRQTGERAFFLDWMGMGRSTRRSPKVFAPMRKMGEKEGVEAAEDFFLIPLRSFFEMKRIKKANLIAHSLGGYLSAVFALRYPDLVKSLMLLSSAGIPSYPDPPHTPPPTPSSRRPSHPVESENALALEAPSRARLSEEHGVDGDKLERALNRTATHDGNKDDDRARKTDKWDSPSAALQFEEAIEAGELPDSVLTDEDENDDDSERRPQTFKGPLGNGKRMQALYRFMWEAGYSPLGFLRKAGPIGPLMLGKYSRARFNNMTASEQTDLNSYLSNITLLPGSGEYAVGILLVPGAIARFPIADRIAALGKGVPVSFVYGELDWMDVHGGKDAVRALRRVGNKVSEVVVVPEAGHHVYFDNSEWMNAYFLKKLLPSHNSSPSPLPQSDLSQTSPLSPLSSSFPTPASTALQTPRGSVSRSPKTEKIGIPPVA